MSKLEYLNVEQELIPDQPPLGSQFKSYELSKAPNYWVLDPFQYSITKFKYNNNALGQTDNNSTGCHVVDQSDFKNDPGLIYKNVNFEKLLPAYTSTKKSVNDFPAQSYHRFLANDGYFNPRESIDNTDLWYYGASNEFKNNGISGAQLNQQEVNHIIFPEAQRGGLNTSNLAKYSWNSVNNLDCQFFNYNSHYSNNQKNNNVDKVYSFDSNYCRNIGISSNEQGSMPYYKQY